MKTRNSTQSALACRICLVRHGETAWNAERRLQGHIDVPLNPRGLSQAEATARSLARSSGGVFSLVTPAGNMHSPVSEELPADWGMQPLLYGARSESAGRTSTATVAFKLPRELVNDWKSIERTKRRH